MYLVTHNYSIKTPACLWVAPPHPCFKDVPRKTERNEFDTSDNGHKIISAARLRFLSTAQKPIYPRAPSRFPTD